MEKKRDALDAAIDNMRAWLGATGSLGSAHRSSQSQEIASDTFFGLGITEAIKKYLKMAKGKKSTNDIVQALEKGGITHASKDFRNTVSTTLYRESSKPNNEIVKIGEGEWGLLEWYPGMRSKRNKGKEQGDESASTTRPFDPDEIDIDSLIPKDEEGAKK